MSLKLRPYIFCFKILLDKGLNCFYAKFQLIILKHTLVIKEENDGKIRFSTLYVLITFGVNLFNPKEVRFSSF